MGLIIYNLLLVLYRAGIYAISPWNPKAKSWIKGRKSVFDDLRSAMGEHRHAKIVWMHCASLGEFEQGRPVLEQIKSAHPDWRIVLTFFSASGYDVQKNYKGADFICYLPIDSSRNARNFIDIVQPNLVFWVKYEYWYHYLTELKTRGVPLLLISGIFRSNQLFFKWYGTIYRGILHCFSHLFVQTHESKKLLQSIGIFRNVTVSGDTRFDRVIEIAEQFESIEIIEQFCNGSEVIVAGSTWQEDEEELDHFANTHQNIKFIIAPHQIDRPHLNLVKNLFRRSLFFSELNKADGQRPPNGEGADGEEARNVLIIDNIGMLSRLYKYASIAYVGGGFGEDGVHNILEAAVYGKPVIFGPEYEKFVEAEELVNCGGAFSIENALNLEEVLNVLLRSPYEYKKACDAAKGYVYSKQGATAEIMKYLFQNDLLPAPGA